MATLQRMIAMICVLGASYLRAEVPEEFQRRLRSEMTSQHAFIGQAPLFQRVDAMAERAGVPRSELIELLLGWVEQGHRLPDSEANARARVLASTSAGVAGRLGNATLIPVLERYAISAEYPTNEVAASSALDLAFREDPSQIPALAEVFMENGHRRVDLMLALLVPREAPLASQVLSEKQAIVLRTIRQLYFREDAESPIFIDQTLARHESEHQHSESRYEFLMRLRIHENPRRQAYAEEQLSKDFSGRSLLATTPGVQVDAPVGPPAQQAEAETGGTDQEGSGQTTGERRFPTGALIAAVLVGGLLYSWMRFMHHK